MDRLRPAPLPALLVSPGHQKKGGDGKSRCLQLAVGPGLVEGGGLGIEHSHRLPCLQFLLWENVPVSVPHLLQCLGGPCYSTVAAFWGTQKALKSLTAMWIFSCDPVPATLGARLRVHPDVWVVAVKMSKPAQAKM